MAWSTIDVLIFAVAAYVAVVTRVRLMRNRHDQLTSQVRTQLQAEQRRRKQSAQDEPPQEDAA